MKPATLAFCVFAAALVPHAGLAKPKPQPAKTPKESADKPATDPAALPAEAPPPEETIPSTDPNGEPAGASERPTSPKTDWDKAEEVKTVAVVEVKSEFPLEEIDRPLTLPRHWLEAAVEFPLTVEPGSASGLLRVNFGFTDRFQMGIRYGMFTATSDKTFSSKGYSIDAEYAVLPWLNAQVALPFYTDPYSQGLVLGAPLRIHFLGKFAIEGLRDLVTIKIHRFAPSVENGAYDDARVQADEINQLVDDGELNFLGAFLYQHSPKLMLDGRYGLRMPDFKQDGAPVLLDVGAHYSTSTKFEVTARVGFDDLGDGIDGFAARLSAIFRL